MVNFGMNAWKKIVFGFILVLLVFVVAFGSIPLFFDGPEWGILIVLVVIILLVIFGFSYLFGGLFDVFIKYSKADRRRHLTKAGVDLIIEDIPKKKKKKK